PAGNPALLRGADKSVARVGVFAGPVFFFFPPAYEGGHGAKRMIEDGLFERFPCEQVFGMHNMPGYEANTFAVRKGPLMAAVDVARVTLNGVGGHGAFPHLTRDPVIAGARLVEAWNGIVSRRVPPLEAAVISVTQFEASQAVNVIPDQVTIAATVRSLTASTRKLLEQSLHEAAHGVAAAHGITADFVFEEGDCATVNADEETDLCAEVAAKVVGPDRVQTNIPPMMGSEDFGWMLAEKPGCYLFLGNGIGDVGGCMVHNPHYDFNDNILATGAAYWVELARTALPIR
ncbi:MAG: amidohydrolase, partial [Pseudomonadota bacterium]